MSELEIQQHLNDCLFHGVHKYIRDSIRYLYSTPGTSYSQLMVATHKGESENEEIWDKVRARAAMTTDSQEDTTELGQQIAKLMATLTRAGQGSSPASAPNSPRESDQGRGQTDRGTSGHPSSHNGQTSLGQTASDHSTPTDHRTVTTVSRNQGRTMKRLILGMKVQPIGETPTLSSALGAWAGAIWFGNVPLQPQL